MNRRSFLLGPKAWAGEPSQGETLVVLFLRGGCDALNLIFPISGPDRKIYEDERPNLKMKTETALALDERLGLHPSAVEFHKLYQQKKLGIIPAAGMKSNNRSHFDAQAFMELGTPDRKSTVTGWITRHLGTRVPANPFRSIAISATTPASLLGCTDTTAVLQPRRFASVGGDKLLQVDMCETLSEMYKFPSPVSAKCATAISVVRRLGADALGEYVPKDGIEYPKNDLANRLKVLAQLMKLGLGLQVATIDMGGWDTHKYQGQNSDGTFAKNVEQLSQAVAAFYQDINEKATVVVMSEFGRRLRENANRGTDHGHGGMMMVLGSGVHGGRVYGEWPGLKTEQLYERADLAVTTDFRQVLGEVLVKRRREHDLSRVFPDFKMEKDLDLFKALV